MMRGTFVKNLVLLNNRNKIMLMVVTVKIKATLITVWTLCHLIHVISSPPRAGLEQRFLSQLKPFFSVPIVPTVPILSRDLSLPMREPQCSNFENQTQGTNRNAGFVPNFCLSFLTSLIQTSGRFTLAREADTAINYFINSILQQCIK